MVGSGCQMTDDIIVVMDLVFQSVEFLGALRSKKFAITIQTNKLLLYGLLVRETRTLCMHIC